MKRAEAEKRLRALGLRVPLDTVIIVARRLRNGDSLYSLYSDKPPLLSKVTAGKIRDLLITGELNFVLDLEDLPSPVTESIELSQRLTVKEWKSPGISRLGEPGPPPPWVFGAPRRPERLRARLEEIRPLLPRVRWELDYLEGGQVPPEIGLQLLVEHDLLEDLILNGSGSYDTVLRFVALHYIVRFYLYGDKPPHNFIELAAMTYARGLIDGNRFLRSAGEGIVRYQVWRGRPFLDAFVSAQQPASKESARLRVLEQKIEREAAEWDAEDEEREQALGAVQEAEKGFQEETDPEAKAKLLGEWRQKVQDLESVEFKGVLRRAERRAKRAERRERQEKEGEEGNGEATA